MTSRRIGKYACLEIERRYLVNALPEVLLDSPEGWRITDRYFPRTRLRLRSMQARTGDERIDKLTQKYRSETQTACEATLTNIYLSEAEVRLFAALEGNVLQKTRFPYALPGASLSIDVFEGRHQGLILAEMEMEDPGMQLPALPAFILREVTEDPFFTGGNLAAMSEAEFRQGLSQRLRDRADR